MKFNLIHIIYPLLSLLIGILLSLYSIPKIISWAGRNKKLDIPNWRSSHNTPVPSYGGLSFNLSLLVSSMLFISSTTALVLITCILIIGILGYLDDSMDLKARRKFMVQFALATFIYYYGIQINSLQGIFGIYQLPTEISYALTVIFVVGVTNAYNLIDGVDGLAGSLGAISCFTFSVIFFILDDIDYMIISLTLTGSILGFLKFNLSPAKIFMGDCGSLVIGFTIAILFIRVLSQNNSLYISSSASTLMLPCIDMLRLFISRISKKVSPFKADNNHYHHLLIKAGDSHKKVSKRALYFTAYHIIITLGLDNYYDLGSSLMLSILICSLIYIWIELRFYRISKKQNQHTQNSILKIIGENNLLNQKI